MVIGMVQVFRSAALREWYTVRYEGLDSPDCTGREIVFGHIWGDTGEWLFSKI